MKLALIPADDRQELAADRQAVLAVAEQVASLRIHHEEMVVAEGGQRLKPGLAAAKLGFRALAPSDLPLQAALGFFQLGFESADLGLQGRKPLAVFRPRRPGAGNGGGYRAGGALVERAAGLAGLAGNALGRSVLGAGFRGPGFDVIRCSP